MDYYRDSGSIADSTGAQVGGAVMVLIGIGSNRGDSGHIVDEACDYLEHYAQSNFRRSSLWLTTPVDCPPGSGDFINAAVAFKPLRIFSPEKLLRELKALEALAGRLPNARRNEPRLLDLDLLVYDQQLRRSHQLRLPHPRAAQRRFVLAPAAEVVPDLRWPGLGMTVSELLSNLAESDEGVRRLEGPL